MAFAATIVNGRSVHFDKKEFVCNSVDDIANLPRCGIPGITDSKDPHDKNPCAIGSTAFVMASSEVYMLGPDNVWAKI